MCNKYRNRIKSFKSDADVTWCTSNYQNFCHKDCQFSQETIIESSILDWIVFYLWSATSTGNRFFLIIRHSCVTKYKFRRKNNTPTQTDEILQWHGVRLKIMVRADGIEPTTPAWKAGVLPLNYARKTWLAGWNILCSGQAFLCTKFKCLKFSMNYSIV